MVELQEPRFDAAAFLASAGLGRRIIQLAPQEAFFSQGDAADAVFYLQKGRAKVTVVSPAGKEATIALLSVGDFVGEEALAATAGLRLASATAMTPCTALRISRGEMIHVMAGGPGAGSSEHNHRRWVPQVPGAVSTTTEDGCPRCLAFGHLGEQRNGGTACR
jgi:CRP-like cAMP-binding protein